MTDASEPTAVRARVTVTGRVQGVGYRAFTVLVATQRGLVGGVRNLDDGRVELEVEGPKDSIVALLEELRVGPPSSRVTAVQTEWSNATGRYADFLVWY
jgi:acylphosphatase